MPSYVIHQTRARVAAFRSPHRLACLDGSQPAHSFPELALLGAGSGSDDVGEPSPSRYLLRRGRNSSILSIYYHRMSRKAVLVQETPMERPAQFVAVDWLIRRFLALRGLVVVYFSNSPYIGRVPAGEVIDGSIHGFSSIAVFARTRGRVRPRWSTCFKVKAIYDVPCPSQAVLRARGYVERRGDKVAVYFSPPLVLSCPGRSLVFQVGHCAAPGSGDSDCDTDSDADCDEEAYHAMAPEMGLVIDHTWISVPFTKERNILVLRGSVLNMRKVSCAMHPSTRSNLQSVFTLYARYH